jgi:hypothetical protein
MSEPSARRFHQHLVEASIWELLLQALHKLCGYVTQDHSEGEIRQIGPPENFKQWVCVGNRAFDGSNLVMEINKQRDLFLPMT